MLHNMHDSKNVEIQNKNKKSSTKCKEISISMPKEEDVVQNFAAC